ncbi:MAG: cell division protein FtsQ/DivIB [Pseudomonadota bacterium]
MAAKQARRKKAKRSEPRVRVTLPWKPVLALLLTAAGCYVVFVAGTLALNSPIRALDLEAPLQRVSQMQILAAAEPYLEAGFASVDLGAMRASLEALDWVDVAVVRRRWPDRVQVLVVEQVPAARWGEDGLLNTRGELFVNGARHIPTELPRLSGPEGSSDVVARRYLAMHGRLVQAGLRLSSVELDERGSWRLTLANGVDVRLGRRDVDERGERFLTIVSQLVSRRQEDIDFVDMRYSNGFSIGWKHDDYRDRADNDPSTRPVLAASKAAE